MTLCLPVAATAQSNIKFGEWRSLYENEQIAEVKFKINDLVLILVEESGSASNNTNINLRRKYDLKAEVNNFVSLDPSNLTLRAHDPTNFPSMDIKSEKRREGRGSTDRRKRFTTKITARIVDLLPNGNLIIEGRTTRKVNDEMSVMTIFGEVNPLDVEQRSRIVRLERVADLKVVFSGSGPVTRNAGRAWVSWMLEYLWPF
jgi:flagellar L-ring protein precursor FlgH